MRASMADRDGDAAQSIIVYQRSYDQARAGLAATRAGSVQWVDYLRRASEAGTFVAWARWDQEDQPAADLILADLEQWLKPFDIGSPPPRLRIALARLSHLRSRRSSMDGDQQRAETHHARTLALTAGFEREIEDYGPLAKLRITALISMAHGEYHLARRTEACNLAQKLEQIVPGVMRLRILQCLLDQSNHDIIQRNYEKAIANTYKIEDTLSKTQRLKRSKQAEQLLFVEALGTRAKALDLDTRYEDAARTRLNALSLLIEQLKDTTFAPQRPSQILDAYDAVKDLNLNVITDLNPAGSSDDERLAQLFGDLVQALEPTRQLYRRNPYFATVSASAASMSADAYIRANQADKAISMADSGRKALEDGGLPQQLASFGDGGLVVCQTYARSVDALMLAQQADAAMTAYQRLNQHCGAWLKRYPWDFYARQYLLTASFRLGAWLAKNDRPQQAAPLLRHASNWGNRNATLDLIKILEDFPQYFSPAESIEGLSIRARDQNIKRITISANFDNQPYPFDIYLYQYPGNKLCPAERPIADDEADCVGFRGIDDQVMWLKQARGGAVAPSLVQSYQNWFNIAHEKGISFPDLVSYAISEIRVFSATPQQADAIHKEILRQDFWRNPYLSLDRAGIALRGMDAVSYTQGHTPKIGSAEHFVLYDGAIWFFATSENRATFLERPAYYVPQFGGFASTEMADGEISAPDVAYFLYKAQKLYLFHNDGERNAWDRDTERLAARAELTWLGSDTAATKRYATVQAATPAADAILSIGAVRAPTDIEITRYRLPRLTVLIERLQRDPDRQEDLVTSLGNRSWSNALNLRGKEAVADADRALALDPSQAWIVGNKANALVLQGQIDNAIETYKTVKDNTTPKSWPSLCKSIMSDLDAIEAIAPGLLNSTRRVRNALACSEAAQQ